MGNIRRKAVDCVDRSSNCSVISRKATDKSPISSPRRDRSGMVSSPGRVGEARLNTRMARAVAGSVIVLASRSDVIRLTKSYQSQFDDNAAFSLNNRVNSPGRVDTMSAPIIA